MFAVFLNSFNRRLFDVCFNFKTHRYFVRLKKINFAIHIKTKTYEITQQHNQQITNAVYKRLQTSDATV